MSVPEDFADGKFVLECPEIAIEQGGRMPLNLKGPGRIELNGPRIEWSFHISADQRQELHPIQLLLGQGALRGPGFVLPKEECITFQATTFKGDLWTTAIAQDPQLGGAAGGAGIVGGNAFTLKNTKPALTNGREYVRFYLPGKVSFPALFWTDTSSRGPGEAKRLLGGARDWAQFESGEERFILSYKGNHTEIFCDLTAGAVAAQRHRRMQEALTFALGQLLHPCAIEITADGTLTTILYEWSALGQNARAQDPPLSFGNLPLEEVYDIVIAYYRKASEWTVEEESPIAHGVFSVVHAAQNTIDLHLFQLASAAETLIKNAAFDLPPAEPAFRAEAEELWEKIKAMKMSDELRQRVGRAFNLVLQPNPIKDFVRYRGLADSIFTSWRELRNPAAHGARTPLDDLQTIWKRRGDVLQLCYFIVFAFIGYDGIYTDYTKPRWPYSGKPKIASELMSASQSSS